MSKEKQQSRVDLLVESIAVEKQLIDEACDDLITARECQDKKKAKEVSKRLDPQIKRYNGLIAEYNKLTGESVATISPNLAAEIMAGKSYHGVAPVGSAASNVATTASTVSYNVTNQKELQQYLEKSDKALGNVRSRLKVTEDQKNVATGYNKVLLVINCLTYQRYIIERLAENLAVCCKINDSKKVNSIKKTLLSEIATYNNFTNEYYVITGTKLTAASDTIPQCIIEGKPYPVIPAISYTANDGTTRNSDAEVAAVAASAAAAIDQAKKKNKRDKKNKEVVQKSALEEKIAEQANKDVSVLTKAADYKINLLESDRDMTKFRFGQTMGDIDKKKKAVGKKIKEVQQNHKEALKYEADDNARYYAVITNDPATAEFPKKKADRTKIAGLRSEMMALLNKRDELNSKLLSIYGGTEVNLDGTAVNQKWREIKSAEAEKCIKKNKRLATKIERLHASSSERQKLYSLMNDNIDASSTKALSKYRLKEKDYISKVEKKQLNKDISNAEKTIKSNNSEINRAIKRIKKRA